MSETPTVVDVVEYLRNTGNAHLSVVVQAMAAEITRLHGQAAPDVPQMPGIDDTLAFLRAIGRYRMARMVELERDGYAQSRRANRYLREQLDRVRQPEPDVRRDPVYRCPPESDG
jgi:limonene-1,2-epoxide hydrolase